MRGADAENERPEDLAYHEAGHAIVAWKLGVTLGALHICEELGYARDLLRCRERNPGFMSQRDWDCLEKETQILLGGRAAEYALRIERDRDPDAEPYCDECDQRKLRELVDQLFEDDARMATEWLERANDCAEDIVIDNWTKVQALARALKERQQLSGEEALFILQGR